MTPKEVLELAKKNKVEFVDLKFVDLPGLWQHLKQSRERFFSDFIRRALVPTRHREEGHQAKA